MNILASVAIALLAWGLLSWACGIALGAMIDLMQDEEELNDPWWRRPALDAGE